MRTSCLVVVFVVLSVADQTESSAQGNKGISFSGSYILEEDFGFSAQYFHPILMKQIYATAGLFLTNLGESTIVIATPAGFSQTDFYGEPHLLKQISLGLRLGDYLFIAPKLSYNWHGKRTSIGWGVAGGLLIYPVETFAFGFSI